MVSTTLKELATKRVSNKTKKSPNVKLVDVRVKKKPKILTASCYSFQDYYTSCSNDIEDYSSVSSIPVQKEYNSCNILEDYSSSSSTKVPKPIDVDEYSNDDQYKIIINRSIIVDNDTNDELNKLYQVLDDTNNGYACYGYYENNKPISPFGFDIDGRTIVQYIST